MHRPQASPLLVLGFAQVLLAVLALLAVGLAGAAADQFQASPSVRLGLLLPFPEGDSAVPQRLAQEW